ncbi:MAG TPA: membrane protein insertion efficiency factor YidD [Thermoanaerobaculia bacterium]|nr:membrane protein insertion efficiency factor YidD [Thermoanaerobaculia bacterium]
MSPRARKWAVVLALLLLLAVDLSRPARSQVTARLLVGAINVYQATLSPLMPRIGVQCRFRPSCSRYGEAAIRKYGALRGTAKAFWRIARCGPWTPAGTVDYP